MYRRRQAHHPTAGGCHRPWRLAARDRDRPQGQRALRLQRRCKGQPCRPPGGERGHCHGPRLHQAPRLVDQQPRVLLLGHAWPRHRRAHGSALQPLALRDAACQLGQQLYHCGHRPHHVDYRLVCRPQHQPQREKPAQLCQRGRVWRLEQVRLQELPRR